MTREIFLSDLKTHILDNIRYFSLYEMTDPIPTRNKENMLVSCVLRISYHKAKFATTDVENIECGNLEEFENMLSNITTERDFLIVFYN